MKRSLLVLALMVAPALHASVDAVRQNFIGYYAAAGADRNAPRMQDALSTLEAQTRDITAPGFLLGDGTWSDINYKETPGGSWSPSDHFRRLTTMAKAYRTPGQSFYNSEPLRQQIEAALAQVPAFYGKTTLPLGNWWFWTLGAPLDLGPTLQQRARHLAYAGAWKHFEPVWDVLIRSRRVNSALPLLEATLAAFGGRPAPKGASRVRDDVHLAPADALQLVLAAVGEGDARA